MKPWVKFGLLWALWMFIIMTFIAPYIYIGIGTQDESEPKFSLARIVINAIVFTIGGLILGYWNSKKTKAPRKQIDA